MTTALSYPQLKAAVWADRRTRVHAVVDGGVVPGLPARLAEAPSNGWDCLQRGALAPAVAAAAAYVVDLVERSELADWLLAEAPALHPGWGVLLVTPEPLLRVREHCRGLAEALMPSGQRRRWRWWDPEVLGVFLPAASASQLDEVFALGQQMVVPAKPAWTWYRLEEGVLAAESRTLLQPAK